MLESSSFSGYSSSGYTPEETLAFGELTKLYAESGLENVEAPESGVYEHFDLHIEGKKKPRGPMKGMTVGIVHARPSMLTSWCWEYCSKERSAFNAKFDVKREVISLDSDHSMTVFQQKVSAGSLFLFESCSFSNAASTTSLSGFRNLTSTETFSSVKFG